MAIVESYFHVGIVVPDLEAARTHLTETLGIRWGAISEHDIAKRDARRDMERAVADRYRRGLG